jgi:hypothetical protein
MHYLIKFFFQNLLLGEQQNKKHTNKKIKIFYKKK